VRVLIAGGGTGGHLYPGLAVARELERLAPGIVVTFAGTARGLEARVLPREGFELDLLRSAGLRGSLRARIRGAALLAAGLADAWRIVSRRRPDVVVGVGGYSSGPVVLAAALRGIPTLVLEQNAVPGLTNRLLARVVRAAAVAFEATLPYFGGRGFVAGNPVRPEFAARFAGEEIPRAAGGPVRVLVFGGSQGAHAINVAMAEAAPRLRAGTAPLAITHQTGERDLEMVREAYGRAGLDVRVEPYLYDMASEMAAADLVVCRAGATTIAELAVAGRPAILVPLPQAADDHQRRNARVLEEAGAAVVIEQRELTGERLAREIAALADDPARRRALGAAVRRFARPEAARTIAERVLALARAGKEAA
jgi:UDP-N-acetylglucosamine--N-acetylmuramyl-(pentapeptide) pyrophosphoryl-undecaprenol N-acetylglucosamine transferase